MRDWQFWIAAGGMVLAVAGVLIAWIWRGGRVTAASDVQIYRDQLAEVDRDVVRGTLTGDEAARLRVEVARRLLAADAGDAVPLTATGTGRLIGLIALVLGASVAGYLWLGAPGYPDIPLAARIADAEALRAARPTQAAAEADITLPTPPAPDAEFAALMDQLRARVAAAPGDVTGLGLLARNEANLGNLAAARVAQEALIAAKGADVTAQDHADLAELLIAAAGGYVSPEAEAILAKSLTLDAMNGTARYYSGLMMGQVGRYDLGFRMWQPLVDGAADAPWMPAMRAQMPDMAARAGVNFTLPPLRGPTAAEMAAAQDMTPADRAAMITSMVAQLSDRLATTGGPPEDWARLIASLDVLDRRAEADAILAEAKTVFASDAAALAIIAAARP
jgi:cytochrome c-type biogenesis protein CcmH